MANGDMWTKPRLHGKSHYLFFHKDEQQDKHLEDRNVMVLSSTCNPDKMTIIEYSNTAVN